MMEAISISCLATAGILAIFNIMARRRWILRASVTCTIAGTILLIHSVNPLAAKERKAHKAKASVAKNR